MPLVAHSDLPTFERLKREGQAVLTPGRALHQDIRAVHVGLLNMMPDKALAATERQFFRLVGQSNQIAQFYIHPFTLREVSRGPEALAYIEKYYTPFEDLQKEGLDALIISGANVTRPDLSAEPFWQPLIEVIDWAVENVTSTLCSCLATHAILQFRYGQRRRALAQKCWGVYGHRVVDGHHPIVSGVNTLFDVPHSRFNEVTREQFESAGLHVLVESEAVGVHMAVSEDWFRVVFFQGHPEYDTNSLLKEYKREVTRFANGEREHYPPFPENYLSLKSQAILEEHQDRLLVAMTQGKRVPPLPEDLIAAELHNTWRDTTESVVDNWMGTVYQITHQDRRLPFMDGVDPEDPLDMKKCGVRSAECGVVRKEQGKT